MKHGFLSTKIIQLKVFGPPLILDLKFKDHPNNSMYVELESWPINMRAAEAKEALIAMGATMYLLTREGDPVIEEHPDYTIKLDYEIKNNVYTSN